MRSVFLFVFMLCISKGLCETILAEEKSQKEIPDYSFYSRSPEPIIITPLNYHLITEATQAGILICKNNSVPCKFLTPNWNEIVETIYIPKIDSEDEAPSNKIELVIGICHIDQFENFVPLSDEQDGTIVWFNHGEEFGQAKADQRHSADSLLNWIQQIVVDTLPTLDKEALKNLQKNPVTQYASAVLFDSTGSKWERALVKYKTAYEAELLDYYLVSDPELVQTTVETNEPTLCFYQHFRRADSEEISPVVKVSLQDMEPTSLHKIVVELAAPNSGEMSQLLYVRSNILYDLVIYVGFDSTDQASEFSEILESVATSEKVGIIWDVKDRISPGLIAAGASGTVWPTAVAAIENKPIVWDESRQLTRINLRLWVNELRTGSYSVFKRSEPIPEETNELVKKLVFNNYQSELDLDDDAAAALVFFVGGTTYAGFDVSALDTLKKIATYYDYYDVPVHCFYYDVDKNYPPEEISSTPTAVLFFKGNKYPYTGAFTSKPIISWIDTFVDPDNSEL